MSGYYKCCYSSGGQFVFAERPRSTLAGLLALCWCGLLLGLFVAAIVTLAGVLCLELVLIAVACFTAYQAYHLTFQRMSSSVDLVGYVCWSAACGAILAVVLIAIRWSLCFDFDAPTRCAVFGGIGVVFGTLVYVHITYCCQEDERKHQLALCSPEGAAVPLPSFREEMEHKTWEMFVSFMAWILSWRWWCDLRDPESIADEESKSSDPITVHNHTLKLIKVCVYAPEDMVCWVPFGGISGRCVGLITAGSHRSFSLPRRRLEVQEDSGHYRLKVFQPGLFDKELACYPKAQRGHTFAFHDVEGMVKRSRVLSSARIQPKVLVPEGPTSESEDDLASSTNMLARQDGEDISTLGKVHSRIGNGLSCRQHSAENLQLLHAACLKASSSGSLSDRQGLQGSPPNSGRPVREARRAAPDEIVVRNRSNQEICARLFRSNDYCFLVPLVGKITQCGDCILPEEERRFDPKTAEKEFTLKVYSVGAASKELTYLTVTRGHTYVFCDSLLS